MGGRAHESLGYVEKCYDGSVLFTQGEKREEGDKERPGESGKEREGECEKARWSRTSSPQTAGL